MIKPELFDIVELLVNIPQHNQLIGNQGTIVECFDDGKYEVEFSNKNGETLAICTLSSQQFIIVWRAETQTWVPTAQKLAALLNNLPEEKQIQVLDFARSLHQDNAAKV